MKKDKVIDRLQRARREARDAGNNELAALLLDAVEALNGTGTDREQTLVQELDVALNGLECATAQPSLADLVRQVKDRGVKLVQLSPSTLPSLSDTGYSIAELRAGAVREADAMTVVKVLANLLWKPENENFALAVTREAGHQLARWSSTHEAGKAPGDYFWLVGYLAGKALAHAMQGNAEKAMHHTISTAAVLSNWHARLAGADNGFRPGLGPDRHEVKPPLPEYES